jgi:two-component system, cell cycle response regulator DivK
MMRIKQVLVVDDEADQRKIYVAMLAHHGYRVLEAADGEEAVRCARRDRPDVILMDAVLPRLDGWKATESIKREPETASIPVVMITAHALDGDRERGRAAGVDRYVTKPCMPATVLEEVRRLVGPADGTDGG